MIGRSGAEGFSSYFQLVAHQPPTPKRKKSTPLPGVTGPLFVRVLRVMIGCTPIVAVLALPSPAIAGQATNTVPVSVTVLSGCSLRTRPLQFVALSATATAVLDASSTLTVTCNPGTNFRIEIDQGQHSSLLNRRMYSPTSGNYVIYEVYRDALRLLKWGTGPLDDGTGNSGTGAPVDLTMYGRVPAAAMISPGDYKDTLKVPASAGQKFIATVKTKTFDEGDFVLVGVERQAHGPVIALLARQENGQLAYAGGAAVTLKEADRDLFWRSVEKWGRKSAPVQTGRRADAWVEPRLHVRARYLRSEEKLRHSTLKGLL